MTPDPEAAFAAFDLLRTHGPALLAALEDAQRLRDAPAVRVTGSGHSWEGGGKTTLIIDGDHHVELLRMYRVVLEPVTAYGEVK